MAQRHMQAIRDCDGDLAAICDINDSLGIVDGYNRQARCFHDESEFFDFVDGNGVEYVAICTPNYLHFRHACSALDAGANVISEKPLVLAAADLDVLQMAEDATGHEVCTVLQLRYSNVFESLRKRASAGHHKVKMNYCAPRGEWYDKSWKGDPERSGGIVFNIGAHMFDLLIQLFGGVDGVDMRRIRMERADVEWALGTDRGRDSVRELTFEGEAPVDFSGDFTSLHTKVYEEVLSGRGIRIGSVRPSVELMCEINRQIVGGTE